MSRPEFYFDNDENDWNLPIPVTQAGSTAWRNVFQISIPALKKGDLIKVMGTAEIRLNGTINTEFVSKVTLTPGLPYYAVDLWGYNGTPGVGYFLQPIAGHNVDPQAHYFNPQFIGMMEVPADMPSSVITAGVRCRSTAATGNESGTIMRGYGRMLVEVWRAETP
jgi:hypothetical protein